MYGSPGMRESRSFQQFSKSRVLSPQFHYQPSPQLKTSLYAPGRPQEPLTTSSDFINELQAQTKRISPNFSFKYSSESPMAQALACFTQAINYFLSERSKFSKNSEIILQRPSEDNKEDAAKIKEELEKAKETIKSLNRYEQLLKKKEDKVFNDKQKILSEQNRLKELEEELLKLKEEFEDNEKMFGEHRRKEEEKLRGSREEAEKMIMEAKDLKERLDLKVEETGKLLKYEKEGLLQMESRLNKTKTDLTQEQKKFSLDKLELEREKWKIEQRERKIDETEKMLSLKAERLEQDKQELDKEKQGISQLKARIEEEKFELSSLKDQKRLLEADIRNLTSSSLDIFRSISADEFLSGDRSSTRSRLKSKDSEEKDEIEQAYKDLQLQMEKFNKDLAERESALDEKELSLSRAENDIICKLEMLRLIESSLNESKAQLDELRTQSIPELETQSELLESLLSALIEKKSEIEKLSIQLYSDIDQIQENKPYPYSNANRNSDIGSLSSAEIREITKVIEKRMIELSEKEEQLEQEAERLMIEKDEIVQTAEFLKQAHLQAEQNRDLVEKELNIEKEKINEMAIKAEIKMKAVLNKEAEVASMRKMLEDKDKCLRAKEEELKSRFILSKSHSSSMSTEKDVR